MTIIPELFKAIESELGRFGRDELLDAAQELSHTYRQGQASRLRLLPRHHIAYAATRMPATLAVTMRVLDEIKLHLGEVQIKSLADLGAGPGTAAWAAHQHWPDIENITLLEQDFGFIGLGKKLAAYSESPALQRINWLQADLKLRPALAKHDLVVASYSLGELKAEHRQAAVSLAIEAANIAVVVVEPGTPSGYAAILAIRDQLIAAGLSIVAPCPHQAPCPMTGSDWCHFSERLERAPFHRHIKNVSLGYEDEKYSYIIATKLPMQHYRARIVRMPLKRSGHIYLDLCTKDGIKREVVAKSNKNAFHAAKKRQWGDMWEND